MNGAYVVGNPWTVTTQATTLFPGLRPTFPGAGDRFNAQIYHHQNLQLSSVQTPYWNPIVEVPVVAAPFDPALFEALNHWWRDIVFSVPEVAASGSFPSDLVPA